MHRQQKLTQTYTCNLNYSLTSPLSCCVRAHTLYQAAIEGCYIKFLHRTWQCTIYKTVGNTSNQSQGLILVDPLLMHSCKGCLKNEIGRVQHRLCSKVVSERSFARILCSPEAVKCLISEASEGPQQAGLGLTNAKWACDQNRRLSDDYTSAHMSVAAGRHHWCVCV